MCQKEKSLNPKRKVFLIICRGTYVLKSASKQLEEQKLKRKYRKKAKNYIKNGAKKFKSNTDSKDK